MPKPATKSRQELRSRFVRNAIPSETDFADLIGASLNQADDGLLKLSDGSFGLVNPSQKPDQPVPVLRFFADPTAEGAVWQLQLGAGDGPSLSLTAADGKPVLFVDRATGNIGIGTDKLSARLHISHTNQDPNGGTLILGPTGQSNLRLGYNQDYSWIQSHGSKPLAINAIGNHVGIGTAAPACKLDVVGSTRVSGSLQISQKPISESDNSYHVEIFAPDSGTPGDYTKIRFHQGNQYWAWLGYHGLSQNSSGEFVFWNLNQGREARARCGDLVAKGTVVRSLWATSGNGPDDATDMGRITTRTLRMTKLFADTALRVVYCDNFRVAGKNVACRWEIRVDGISVAPPIIADRYEELGNRHHHGTVMGYARGVAAGVREIQVWVVGHPHNNFQPTDAHTGWSNSTWTLEAEEVWMA